MAFVDELKKILYDAQTIETLLNLARQTNSEMQRKIAELPFKQDKKEEHKLGE